MRSFSSLLFFSVVLLSLFSISASGPAPVPPASPQPIFGFRDSAAESATEARFLPVPDPQLAEEHLRTLTQAPHMAGTPEDKATADYVAQKFRAAGLDTEIVEYKVWINYPLEISVDITAPAGVEMHGPTREHVIGDTYQDDPRVVMPFNGMSPSGDAEADVVYANYGTPEDFEKLEKLKVDVRGKIVLVRYGQNFRGVKEFIAQEHGAAGVIIYSDPFDDGWRRGDKYPDGPWRPDTGVQRGSVGYMFEFPGDPTAALVTRQPARSSREVGADAEDSSHSALLSRCVADPSASGWPRFAARMAGCAAFHLSRGAGSGTREDAPQAGLSDSHFVGCDRQSAWQRVA
jgi:N-acetylated-alpha-linked acidic dipeptidase